MALSRTAKIWIIILAIPVILLIIAVIGLKLYFTGDRLKAMIIPRVEQATNRTMEVRDLSFTVFPSVGVEMEGVTLSNPRGVTFERNEFVALDRLQVEVKFMPLLSSRIEADRILLEHPVIYLEVRNDGVKNYASPEKAANALADTAPAARGEGITGQELFANVEIRNGEILMVNKKFDSRMIIEGYEQTARAEKAPGSSDLRLTFEASIPKFSYGTLTSLYLEGVPVTVKGGATVILNENRLTVDKTLIKLKELPLEMTGAITGLNTVPMLDLAVNAPDATMEHVLSLVPQEMLKAAEGLSSSGDVDVAMTIKGPVSDTIDPGVNGSFTVSNGKVKYNALPKAITGIALAGTFDKPTAHIDNKDIGTFTLEKFSAQLGSNTIGGTLGVVNFNNPQITATINGAMNLNEVRDFYPLDPGSEFSGMMKANVNLTGKAKVPASIKADGTLEFQNVTIKTATSERPLRNLNGTISVNNQLVESKQLAMDIGESDLSLSFTLRNYLAMVLEDKKESGKPSANMTLRSHKLRTADLMSSTGDAAAPAEKKSGGDQTALLPGIDIAANVTIDELVTEKFTFTNVRGGMTVSEGIINLQNLSLNAFDGSIVTKGALDVRNLDHRPFDLDLTIKGVNAQSLLPHFTSFGENILGNFSMTTRLKGDLNDTLGLNRETLLGEGSVEIQEGKIMGYPLTMKLADFTGVNELREVSFSNWVNSFTIENGRMTIPNLTIGSGVGEFMLGGTQGLDGSMDFLLSVKLPPSVSDRIQLQGIGNELLQLMKDKEGRVNLNFTVTGDVTSPALKLDTKAQEDQARKALENKANEAKKRLEEDLKKKAGEGLKKLLKKP